MKGFNGAFATIDFAFAQFGPEGDISTKGIEGKVAVMAIVSVEVSSFLMAVEGVISGVKIDDDFFALSGNGFDSLFNNEVFNRGGIGDDFLVSVISRLRGKLESVESGVTGEGFALVIGVATIFPFEV